ncbi:MAG: ATP-binding protein [Chloroflexota bacterium]
MVRPITRTNLDHLQLLRDEDVFISILENLNSGVALIDSKGRFISYNKKFLNLFGLAEQSTIKNVNDQNWAEWQVFNEDMEVLHVDEHPVRKTAITGKSVSNQLCGVRLPSGGDIIWMLISAEPLFDNEGRIIKTICTYLDVTDHRIADAALRKSEATLRELNATKDKLFSIISHDLKGPFSSIVGFSELLVEKLGKNDLKSVSDYGRIILESSWQAMDLLTNLIEWSRLQTGRMSYNPAPERFVAITESVIRLLNASAFQKSIDIIVEIHPDIKVMADRAMVSTILRNLISNAIKFTKPGGKIIINASEKNNNLHVGVTDTGIGMSRDLAEKLFRFDATVSNPGTHNEKGTGLGMILCKDFISKHDGEIWVESSPGKGSTFFFTLPLA